MALLKKWRRHDEGGHALAKRESPSRHDRGLTRFRDEMERAFDRMWRDLERGGEPWSALANFPSAGAMADWPAIDETEDERAVTLRVDVPGLDAKDVDVEVSGNLLTVRGQREEQTEDKGKGWHRRERRSGSFARTLPLPSYVDTDRIEARYDKGTLTVTIPKIPGQGPRRVEVKQ
jgi:HSP20 family protein